MAKRKRRVKGAGSTDRLLSGRYRARIWVTVNPLTQERELLQRTFDTKKEADDWRLDRYHQERKGIAAGERRHDVQAWCQEFVTLKKVDTGFTTWRSYESKLRHLIPYIGHLPLRDLKREHLEATLVQMEQDGFRANSRRRSMQVLRTAFTEAEKRGLIAVNPTKHFKLPRKEFREMQIWTSDQVRTFLEVAQHEIGWARCFIWPSTPELGWAS